MVTKAKPKDLEFKAKDLRIGPEGQARTKAKYTSLGFRRPHKRSEKDLKKTRFEQKFENDDKKDFEKDITVSVHFKDPTDFVLLLYTPAERSRRL